ncbi:MAG: PQQ-binding-like beta-propeller repeat protein [Propionibacteriaceae bacterium]|nr:PQQ-binding-like beta-propeller repeat protein [Propionibacteriaceae bacterium]
MTAADQPVLTSRVNWLRPFLVGTAGMLGACGVLFVILMLLSWGHTEAPEVLPGALLFMMLGAICTTVGLGKEFGEDPTVGVGALGFLLAAVFFFWGRIVVSNAVGTSWQANPEADPMALWASWSMCCLGTCGLVLMVFAVLRAIGAAVVRREYPRWRVMVALLCGALVAGLGVGVGGRLSAQEVAPVRVVTAEAPEQLPQLGPVFDATEATGEVGWVFRSPELTGRIEMHVGVRGPIIADRDTVVALDGETGQELWNHGLRTRALEPLWALPPERKVIRHRLVVAPNGTAVAFVSCVTGQEGDTWGGPVVTVLDAATGKVRFTFRRETKSCSAQVSMTDRVVVVDGVARDLVAGGELWRFSQPKTFMAGPNGSTHLLVVPDEEQNQMNRNEGKGCSSCDVGPAEIVSDQDPGKVVEQLPRVVALSMNRSGVMRMRNWVLAEDETEGNYSWVNIDTRQRIPVQRVHGDEYWVWRTDTLALQDGTTEVGRGNPASPYQVFDPWAARSEVVMGKRDNNNAGAVGIGVWTRLSASKNVLKLVRPDGALVGEPIELPTLSQGEWEVASIIRTRHGIVSGFTETLRPRGADRMVTIVMHR